MSAAVLFEQGLVVDGSGGPSGADGLAVAFEPDFAGGVAEQVLAVLVGEQRPQM